MKIECVQICVDYSDYIAHTLPFNKYVFDRMVVVTSNKDKATARVCEYYHIECVKTNIFDNEFNKGKAINVGLDQLSRQGWLVHMDSDIILPPRSRYLFEIAKLREDTLYGIDRQMCPSYDEFTKWMSQPYVNHECDIYLHNHSPFPLGTRLGRLVTDKRYNGDLGYVPLGFFQLWYEGGKEKKIYPEEHNSFSRSDILFSYQWTRERRAIIPELVGAIHLSTPDQQAHMGKNWSGRTTARFGPDILDVEKSALEIIK